MEFRDWEIRAVDELAVNEVRVAQLQIGKIAMIEDSINEN